MKRCLKCGHTFESPDWQCASCGFEPEIRNGVPCFAPHLLAVETAFDPGSFDGLAEREEESFWYGPRNQLISWAFRKYFPETKSFFEMGCGTGIVLKELAADYPDLEITGGDIFLEGLTFAHRRLGECARLLQFDSLNLPFEDAFDVAGAFDVIEHIDQDVDAIEKLARTVKPGGGVMIIVPRHMFMWSRVDDLAQHKRRYSGRELHQKVEQAGLQVIRQLTFGALTLPLQYVSRKFMKQQGDSLDKILELRLPKVADSFLKTLLNIDQIPIRAGVNYPFGASLFTIARKVG